MPVNAIQIHPSIFAELRVKVFIECHFNEIFNQVLSICSAWTETGQYFYNCITEFGWGEVKFEKSLPQIDKKQISCEMKSRLWDSYARLTK